MSKFLLLFIALFVSCLSADNIFASATITSVKLNGANNLTVEGSKPITATINVNLTNQSVWKSTAYRFGEGSWNCVNTPDHIISTNAVETFSIITPAKQGTSNVYFEVYDNDDCTNNLLGNVILSPAGLLGSSINFLSFGDYDMWTACLLTGIILLIILLIALYFFKKRR